MSEYEDWLKEEIEKSRKSGLTFVLCGIGLLIVMIIMIIMFKNALPVTFMSIICIFTIAAGSKLKDFFRYRRELRKYYQRQQEDFVKTSGGNTIKDLSMVNLGGRNNRKRDNKNNNISSIETRFGRAYR